MPPPCLLRPLPLATTAVLLLGLALGAAALASGDPDVATDSKGRTLSEITPSTPLDGSAQTTAIHEGQTRIADHFAVTLARYNSGELNYLDLPLMVGDEFSGKPPYTLQSLVERANTVFIGTVASLRWEPEPIGVGAMTIVTYPDSVEVVFGALPPGREVRSRFAGPDTGTDTHYNILDFGVRERVGETYLVFAELRRGVADGERGGFILIDGDRIADSEAARALGIQGRKVDDVVAELRRLKGN